MAYLGQRTFASFEKKSSGWGEDFDEDQELYSDGKDLFNDESFKEWEDEEKKPEKEKGVRIPIWSFRDIPKGDPEHYAMRLFFANVLNLEKDDYRVERVISHFTWENPFPYTPAGTTRNIILKNSVFLSALEYAFEQEGLTKTLYDFTGDFHLIDEPFTTLQRKLISSLVIKYSKITDVDVIYFNKWITKNYSNESNIKIGEVELESLKRHNSLLNQFFASKLENMSDEGTLKSFTTHKSDDRITKLENLKDRINLIPNFLISELIDETGLGIWDTTVSLITGWNPFDPLSSAKKVAEDEVSRFEEIDKKFQKKGFSIYEVFEFKNLFQEIAIGEAFKMLKANHKLLVSELTRYKDDTKFLELYNYLHFNYTPKFKSADILRAKAAVRFLEKMKAADINPYSGGEICKTIYEHRKNISDVAEYIATIQPTDLITALAKLLKIKKFKEKSITDHIKDGIADFKDIRLMIGGDYKFAEYYMEVFNSDPKFKEADLMDMSTIKQITTQESDKFPVLADISFDFRRMRTLSKKKFQSSIITQLEEKKENNEYIQTELENDPSTVWKLELLIEKVRNDYGVSEDSTTGILINDILDDIDSAQFWKNIGLGALGIALGIAGFFTGGSTWAGLALIAGGVAISSYEIYESSQEYIFDDAARDTALIAANELSVKEPSILGIVLGVVGLVLDVGALAKGLKTFNTLKHTKGTKSLISGESELLDANGFIKGTDFKPREIQQIQKGFEEFTAAVKQKRSIEESAEKIYNVLKKGRLKGNPTLEEFIENLNKIVTENKALDKEIIAAIKAAKIKTEIATELTEGVLNVGLKRIFNQDPETAKRLLMSFGDNPKVLFQMINESIFDDSFATTLTKLNKFFPKPSNYFQANYFEKVIVYLSNVRRTGLSSINDLVLNIEKAGIEIPELAAEIIMSPKLQTTFRKMEFPEEISDLWKAFDNDKPSSTFTEYATNKAQYKTVQKINSKYPDFDSLPIRDKNLTLLGDTEGALMDAIKNNKLLPDNKQLKKALDELLEKDLILNTKTLDAARGKVIKEINKTIGENLKNVDEFKQIMKLIEQPGSRGSIGEHFAVAKKLLGTSESNIVTSISIDVKDLGLKNPQKFHPDELIFNKQNGKFGEVKTGYPSGGVDIDQVDNYVTIFQNRFKKEYAPLFDKLGVEPKSFKGVDYLMLPGKSGDDTFKAAAETYNKIMRNGTDEALDMLKYGELKIKYLDSDNLVKVYKP